MLSKLTEVPGVKLNYDNLKFVRDILYFDGPLITEYSLGDETYVSYWCDCDTSHQRWMLLRMPSATVASLTADSDMKTVIPVACLNPFVHFLDIPQEGDPVVRTVLLENIPEDYKPE